MADTAEKRLDHRLIEFRLAIVLEAIVAVAREDVPEKVTVPVAVRLLVVRVLEMLEF